MTTLRRILTTAGLVVAAAGLASATSINCSGTLSNPTVTFGTDASTGLDTVTQCASFAAPLNTNSPFNFGSFNSLGITNGVYESADTTFDYQFSNILTQFQVTNNDTETDTINASVQSLITNSSTTTLPNYPSFSGFLQTADGTNGLLIPNASNTFAPNAGVGTQTTTLAAITGQTLAQGSTYVYVGLPVTYTDGIYLTINGNNGNNACSFGDTDRGDDCNSHFNDSGNFFLTNSFVFGTSDNQMFGESVTGSGNLNLNIIATTNYTAEAEVTYEYTVSTGTPEPTTMVLMGGALVGLGLFGKKRFRKS